MVRVLRTLGIAALLVAAVSLVQARQARLFSLQAELEPLASGSVEEVSRQMRRSVKRPANADRYAVVVMQWKRRTDPGSQQTPAAVPQPRRGPGTVGGAHADRLVDGAAEKRRTSSAPQSTKQPATADTKIDLARDIERDADRVMGRRQPGPAELRAEGRAHHHAAEGAGAASARGRHHAHHGKGHVGHGHRGHGSRLHADPHTAGKGPRHHRRDRRRWADPRSAKMHHPPGMGMPTPEGHHGSMPMGMPTSGSPKMGSGGAHHHR